MKIWLTLIIAILFAFNLFLEIDKEAMQILDASFERAMVAFGLAKALNATISLIQGTELSLTPVGIGLNLSVGEVLDPFNDMVERFSWVMLFSSISLGVQKILLTLSSKVFLQFALGVSAFVSIGVLWIKQLQNRLFFSISLKFFALLIIVRFSAIIFVYSSQLMYNALLDEQYQEATQVITTTKEEFEDIQKRNRVVMKTEKKSGFFQSLDNKYSSIVANLNISKQLDALQQSIDNATHNIITLITVFIFQTLLFPLFYLWILLWPVRWIFAYENLLHND